MKEKLLQVIFLVLQERDIDHNLVYFMVGLSIVIPEEFMTPEMIDLHFKIIDGLGRHE